MEKQNRRTQESLQPASRAQSAPSPELVERFLDLQQHELQMRTEELALHAQQEDNQKSIAESAISANLQQQG